ncbi:MAG: glycosyltransferase family 2 protein, partial [Prevotella sp.]|nr:glycosyltransferase family 2 protein [Prevotella sp.]
MDAWYILYIIDWLLFIPVALTVLYILVFSIAAMFWHREIPNKAKQDRRFIVLIPAYHSDRIIMDNVNSVLGQTYTQRNFDIVVVSDHMEE